MRNAFVRELTRIAESDPDVMLVTGDLGFGVLDDFEERFSDQYLNAGVAEQAMMGLAAGLALEGRRVFVYSISNFPTMRCLEQIRNDVCYHKADVTVVAVGGGYAYGALGMTHHMTEDIAVMCALPNMTVLAPGDSTESAAATRYAYETSGPKYLRLGRGGEPVVRPEGFRLTGPALFPVRDGSDVVLISTGGMMGPAVAAAKHLGNLGTSTAVLTAPVLKPFPAADIRALAMRYDLVATLEEHNRIGGLSSAVADVLAEMSDRRAAFLPLAIPDEYASTVGDQEFLRRRYGLDAKSIAIRVAARLGASVDRDHGLRDLSSFSQSLPFTSKRAPR